MQPPAEHVHWMFATGFLVLGLSLLSEAIVGPEVWRRRRWRAYLAPGFVFVMGVFMWPVMVFFTNSTIHTLAHSAWAQAMMFAGGAELGLVRGKLKNPLWRLAMVGAFLVSGAAIIIHEQNGWFFQRSAFLHHLIGWTVVGATIFALGRALRRRSLVFESGFALTFVVLAVMLYCDRDLAPIFGHLSQVAGTPHR
jgi:FtsH-binding integral membrane protein